MAILANIRNTLEANAEQLRVNRGLFEDVGYAINRTLADLTPDTTYGSGADHLRMAVTSLGETLQAAGGALRHSLWDGKNRFVQGVVEKSGVKNPLGQAGLATFYTGLYYAGAFTVGAAVDIGKGFVGSCKAIANAETTEDAFSGVGGLYGSVGAVAGMGLGGAAVSSKLASVAVTGFTAAGGGEAALAVSAAGAGRAAVAGVIAAGGTGQVLMAVSKGNGDERVVQLEIKRKIRGHLDTLGENETVVPRSIRGKFNQAINSIEREAEKRILKAAADGLRVELDRIARIEVEAWVRRQIQPDPDRVIYPQAVSKAQRLAHIGEAKLRKGLLVVANDPSTSPIGERVFYLDEIYADGTLGLHNLTEATDYMSGLGIRRELTSQPRLDGVDPTHFRIMAADEVGLPATPVSARPFN